MLRRLEDPVVPKGELIETLADLLAEVWERTGEPDGPEIAGRIRSRGGRVASDPDRCDYGSGMTNAISATTTAIARASPVIAIALR